MSTVNAIGNFVWASDSNKNQKERQEQYLELMYMHQQYNGIIIKQNYVSRESKLSCSFGSNYSLLDIGQDHGIYKGNLPLMTTIDSGKNNIYHFGSCLCPESNYAGRLPMTAETHQDGKKAKKAINNKYAHICVPMVPEGSAWKQVDHSIMAKTCAKGYVPVLVDNAVLVCQYGGLITVVEVPQTGTTKGLGQMVFQGASWLELAEGNIPYIYSTKDSSYSKWAGGFSANDDLTFGIGHSIKTIAEFNAINNFIATHNASDVAAEVQRYLQGDLADSVKRVNDFMNNNNVSLKQNQFDAIVCLIFNYPAALSSSSDLGVELIKSSSSGNFNQQNIIVGFTYTVFQGSRIDGLVTRRNNELNLFFTADYMHYYDTKQKVITAGIEYIKY